MKSNQTKLLAVSLLLFCGIAAAEKEVDERAIVEATIEAIELCLHWGGEEAFSEERANQIEEGIERDCAEARRKAVRAHGLFPHNQTLSERLLILHDFGHFLLSDVEKERICDELTSLFEERFERMNYEEPLVRFQCPKQATKIYGNE